MFIFPCCLNWSAFCNNMVFHQNILSHIRVYFAMKYVILKIILSGMFGGKTGRTLTIRKTSMFRFLMDVYNKSRHPRYWLNSNTLLPGSILHTSSSSFKMAIILELHLPVKAASIVCLTFGLLLSISWETSNPKHISISHVFDNLEKVIHYLGRIYVCHANWTTTFSSVLTRVERLIWYHRTEIGIDYCREVI